MKTPDHFDGSLALVTDAISRTQVCEGSSDALSFLRSAYKDQDCIAPLHMMKVNKYGIDGILEIQDAAQSYDWLVFGSANRY